MARPCAQEPCDEKAGEDEEEVDAEVAAANARHPEVVEDDGRDREGPQAVERRQVGVRGGVRGRAAIDAIEDMAAPSLCDPPPGPPRSG